MMLNDFPFLLFAADTTPSELQNLMTVAQNIYNTETNQKVVSCGNFAKGQLKAVHITDIA